MRNIAILVIFLLKIRDIISKPAKNAPIAINDEKLNDLVWKALEGFRYVILDGDDNLEVDSMEPYIIEDNLLWYYDDGVGKTRIYVDGISPIFLHGLSTYTVEMVSANAADLDVEIKLKFNHLQSNGKYKVGGYLFRNIVPIFGNGFTEAKTENIDVKICLNMSLVDSYISVDETSVSLILGQFSAKASNIFKIPAAYTHQLLNEIIKRMYNRYKKSVDNELNEVLLDWMEDTFTGMTMEEVMDLLDYLAKKINSKQSSAKIEINHNY